MFPNVDRIKHVECPTVIFHSVKDEIVPFYHGKELYQASKNKFDPLFIDGTTHNTNDGEIGIFYEHLNKFFNYINENNKVIV